MENKFDPKLVTKEFITKAMACEKPEEIIALAKESGVELSVEEAKKLLEKLEDFDVNISDDDMQKIAGGTCWDVCTSPGTY